MSKPKKIPLAVFCKDCKHWDAPRHLPGEGGFCNMFGSSEEDNAMAFVTDPAGVVTHPDFGCVMGEPTK